MNTPSTASFTATPIAYVIWVSLGDARRVLFAETLSAVGSHRRPPVICEVAPVCHCTVASVGSAVRWSGVS